MLLRLFVSSKCDSDYIEGRLLLITNLRHPIVLILSNSIL